MDHAFCIYGLRRTNLRDRAFTLGFIKDGCCLVARYSLLRAVFIVNGTLPIGSGTVARTFFWYWGRFAGLGTAGVRWYHLTGFQS